MAYEKSVYDENFKTDIPTIKPDLISLGKCAACHQFIHRYSSVNHIDIIELLHTGCKYHGFKRNVPVESEEEESFANMHHVLLLSTLDETETKELCVQRINDYNVVSEQLKNENLVVSDNDSVVIFIYNSTKYRLDICYFGLSDHSFINIDYINNDFNALLDSNVLFLTYESSMLYINFNNEQPTIKTIDLSLNTRIIAMSGVMLVTSKQTGSPSVLQCEHLNQSIDNEISVCMDTLERLTNNTNAIFAVFDSILWLSANDETINVYSYLLNKGLCLVDAISIKSYLPGDENEYVFISFCHSACSKQAFLLYLQVGQNTADKNSFILVFDFKRLKIVSLLEMELTMNREPQLKVCPSRDGGKLLVQERFENRVIFYQIFSLLRSSFLLQRIVKRFIWNNFSKENILSSSLPKHLIKEVLDGF